MNSYGQIAYEGYCSMDDMPRCPWDDLSLEEKLKWEATAQAVLGRRIRMDETPISLHHHD